MKNESEYEGLLAKGKRLSWKESFVVGRTCLRLVANHMVN